LPLPFLYPILPAYMKRSIPLLVLLLTGSVAHAQYGGLINTGVGAVTDNLLRGASKGSRQSSSDFVTTTQYDRRNFEKKRSPADQRPLLGRKQLADLEERLETCYQLLQASDAAPLLVGERSEDALDALIRQVQLMRSTWSMSPYQSEIAFYRDQDRYRRGRWLERAAARAAHQRDSLQVAARQRTATADPLLAVSPTTAYLNVYVSAALLTEPNEAGETIGNVASGSLLSILYRLPEARQCYVCVDGVYGWMREGDLASTLSDATEVQREDITTHTKVRPGFASLKLQGQPAPEAVAPSALAGVVAARAAETAREEAAKARAEAAYAKAHPEPVEVAILNNLVYIDADQYLYLNASYRVSVTYHARASCQMLQGGKIKRMEYSRIGRIASPIDMELCEECGYKHPNHQRAATAKATHTRATSGTTQTKAGIKPHK
jgi:hypothetical protein